MPPSLVEHQLRSGLNRTVQQTTYFLSPKRKRTSAGVFALLCVFFRVEERAQCVCITRKRGAVCQNRLVLRVYSRIRVCDAGGEYNYDLRRMHS